MHNHLSVSLADGVISRHDTLLDQCRQIQANLQAHYTSTIQLLSDFGVGRRKSAEEFVAEVEEKFVSALKEGHNIVHASSQLL